jgi:hypothetical protein
MPYREADTGGYSLARLQGELLEASAWLTGELLRRDWPPPLEPLTQLLAAAAAPERFLEEVRAACEAWQELPEAEAVARSERALEALAAREEREDVYAFLYDLSTAKLITCGELDLLELLRARWQLSQRAGTRSR